MWMSKGGERGDQIRLERKRTERCAEERRWKGKKWQPFARIEASHRFFSSRSRLSSTLQKIADALVNNDSALRALAGPPRPALFRL